MAEKIPCGGFKIDGVTLTIENGVMSASGGGAVANATTTTAGIVKQAEAMQPLTAAPTQNDFNSLINLLKSAGIMSN